MVAMVLANVRRPSKRWVVALLAVTVVAASAAQSPSKQTPVFRSGLDIGHVTVRVLDSKRRPVNNLGSEDFTILVDGVPRPILTLITETAEGPIQPTATWMKEVSSDIATNTLERPRLIVIVLDDALTPDLFTQRTAKEVARKAVDQLGPNDLAAIVFTLDNRQPQDFTADRARLYEAIDRLRIGARPRDGDLWGYANTQSLKTIRETVRFLANVPDLKSLVLYVTVGPGTDPSRPMRSGFTNSEFGANEEALRQEQAFASALSGLQTSAVPVYAICTLGLIGPTTAPIGLNVPARIIYENLRNLSESTGGRAVVANNMPARLVPELFAENTLYYTLAYQADGPLDDGRFRRFEVRVNRPGLTVEPNGERMIRVLPAVRGPAAAETTLALAGAVPLADQPLRLKVTPVLSSRPQTEGTIQIVTVVTLGMDVPADDSYRSRVAIELRVFDGEGRRQLDMKQSFANVQASPRETRHYDLLTTTLLRPGRYNVRASVHDPVLNRSGSVYTDFVVPDFAKTSFSMSEPAVFSPSASIAVPAGITELPWAQPPTTVREFSTASEATTSVRLYWGKASPGVGSAVITSTIVDEDGKEVFRQQASVKPTAANPARWTDFILTLPTKVLAAGEFVLNIRAESGRISATKYLRFRVR